MAAKTFTIAKRNDSAKGIGLADPIVITFSAAEAVSADDTITIPVTKPQGSKLVGALVQINEMSTFYADAIKKVIVSDTNSNVVLTAGTAIGSGDDFTLVVLVGI